MSVTRSFRRQSVLAASVPVALLLAAACDPPRRKSGEEAKVPEAQPVAPATAIPAGGLPPRVVPTESEPAITGTGEDAYRAGRFKEAKVLLAAELASRPEDAGRFHLLGLAAWKSGDWRAAEKAFDRAIALEPRGVRSYLGAARVLLDLGRPQEALERTEHALRLDSTSVDAIRVQARAQAKLGHVDDAVASYRRALLLDEQYVWTLNNLGVLYLDLGDPDAALGPLARAVQLRPESPVFQNNLGVALEQDGYPLAARRAFEAAVRADSGYAKAVANLQRIGAVVTDSTREGPLSLAKVADLFRLEIGMWRDSAVKVEPIDSVAPLRPDSTPPRF